MGCFVNGVIMIVPLCGSKFHRELSEGRDAYVLELVLDAEKMTAKPEDAERTSVP